MCQATPRHIPPRTVQYSLHANFYDPAPWQTLSVKPCTDRQFAQPLGGWSLVGISHIHLIVGHRQQLGFGIVWMTSALEFLFRNCRPTSEISNLFEEGCLMIGARPLTEARV